MHVSTSTAHQLLGPAARRASSSCRPAALQQRAPSLRWGRHEPDAPQQRAARLAARSSASRAVSPHDQGRGVVEAPSCFMSIQEAPIVCARRQSSAPELGAPLCSAGQGGTRGGGAAYLPRSRSSPFPISVGGRQMWRWKLYLHCIYTVFTAADFQIHVFDIWVYCLRLVARIGTSCTSSTTCKSSAVRQ